MYQVENIGYDFIQSVCDCSLVDEWIKTNDDEAFYFVRRLISKEGFLCGSLGTTFTSAIKYIKENNIGKGKRCIVICSDNIRNYTTKFINNDWMYEHGLMPEQEYLELKTPKLIPSNVWG